MVTRLRTRCRDAQGFTLIELTVAVIILGAVMGVVFNAVAVTSKTERNTVNRATVLNEVKTAMDRIGWSVRGANPIVTAQDQSLKLDLVNGNAIREQTWSIVTVSGQQELVLNERDSANGGSTWTPVPQHIELYHLNVGTQAIFGYDDASGAALPPITGVTPNQYDPTAIAAVAVTLASASNGESVSSTDNFELRNG